jgi:hypothetical protein
MRGRHLSPAGIILASYKLSAYDLTLEIGNLRRLDRRRTVPVRTRAVGECTFRELLAEQDVLSSVAPK